MSTPSRHRRFKVPQQSLHLARTLVGLTLAMGCAVNATGAERRTDAIANRIAEAFSDLRVPHADAQTRWAAHTRMKGKTFAAAVCLSEPLPQLGCLGTQAATLARVPTPAVSTSEGDPLGRAAAALDGLWCASGHMLDVDHARSQARLDPSRPFAWQRFAIKAADHRSILFVVGFELYEAVVGGEKLILSGTAFRGSREFRKMSRETSSCRG
jgi:hypothetical protein